MAIYFPPLDYPDIYHMDRTKPPITRTQFLQDTLFKKGSKDILVWVYNTNQKEMFDSMVAGNNLEPFIAYKREKLSNVGHRPEQITLVIMTRGGKRYKNRVRIIHKETNV